LQQPADFNFHDTPLGDVLTLIRHKYDIPVVMDVEALAADGKGADLPITAAAEVGSLENALYNCSTRRAWRSSSAETGC